MKRNARKVCTLLLLAIVSTFFGRNATAQTAPTYDYGDAPETYDTLAADNGAAHVVDNETYLGAWVETDFDGQPHVSALGDDRFDGTDDEDGVVFGRLARGGVARMAVQASRNGYLTLFIDFNGDGSFSGDEVLVDKQIPAGQSVHRIYVPESAEAQTTYARVRFSSRPIAGFVDNLWSGIAANGEVEDYQVTINDDLTDSFEPNDSFESPFWLGNIAQTRDGMSLDNVEDKDIFAWVAPVEGEMSLTFSLPDGSNPMGVQILNADQEPIDEGTADQGNTLFRFNAKAGETFYFMTYPYGEPVPTYGIEVFAPNLCANYVVLFAGGGSKSINFPRYYNNIKGMYEEIVDHYKVPPQNIYILYADGTNSATDLKQPDGTFINSDMTYATNEGATVMAGNNANLEDLLTNTLPDVMDSNDNLLFYAFDHGGGSSSSSTTGEETLTGYSGSTDDADLETWLSALNVRRQTSIHTQCFAGGMIDNMQPTGSNRYGFAATNHFEFSWGDGFAAAVLAGLKANKSNTYDLYKYAHDNDPFAVTRGTYTDNGTSNTAGNVEHPWATGTNNYAIFCYDSWRPWWLDYIYDVWVPPLDEVIFTFDDLLGHTDGLVPTTGPLTFRIDQVMLGDLYKDGELVQPGLTQLSYGESLTWRVPARANRNSNEQMLPFSVRLGDGESFSDTAVDVPVRFETGRAGLAADDEFEVSEDSRSILLDVLQNDSGEIKTILAVGQPAHGTVKLIDGSVYYTPAANFHGQDSFTYSMGDNTLETGDALVNVRIAPVNDPPVPFTDLISVEVESEVSTISPLIDDYDADLDTLTASLATRATTPAGGTVIDNGDNTFSYTAPPNGYTGPDSFAISVSDGTAAVASTVQIEVVAQTGYDWGDAPQFPPQTGVGYPTSSSYDGARHLIGGPYFGQSVDSEAEGVPNADALGDDSSNGNDEDGITLSTAVRGATMQVTVEVNGVSGGAVIDGWIDWDQNRHWYAADRILNETVTNGTHVFNVAVPIDAVAGETFARFRISSAGGLSETGAAADGEVEDYALTIFSQPPTSVSDSTLSVATARPLMVLAVALFVATLLTVVLRRSQVSG